MLICRQRWALLLLALLRRLCSSTASEWWFGSGRFYGIDYYNGQHGGRRGRALGAQQVDAGGAGGVGGAFFVCVMRVAARSEAVCCAREHTLNGRALARMRAAAVRRDGSGQEPPRAASC